MRGPGPMALAPAQALPLAAVWLRANAFSSLGFRFLQDHLFSFLLCIIHSWDQKHFSSPWFGLGTAVGAGI